MPEGLVFDATTGLVEVGLRSPDGIALVDRDGRLVRRVDLDGAPRHLALVGPGGPVLVPAEGSDQLVTVALPDGRVESVTPVGRNPHDAVAVGMRVFVGNEFADSVSVVDNAEVVDEISAPVQPGGIGASGDAVAVVGVRGRQTKVFDAASLDELGTPVIAAGPTHVVGDDDRLFVADTNGDAILVLSAGPEIEEIARIEAAGAPYGMAIDPCAGSCGSRSRPPTGSLPSTFPGPSLVPSPTSLPFASPTARRRSRDGHGLRGRHRGGRVADRHRRRHGLSGSPISPPVAGTSVSRSLQGDNDAASPLRSYPYCAKRLGSNTSTSSSSAVVRPGQPSLVAPSKRRVRWRSSRPTGSGVTARSWPACPARHCCDQPRSATSSPGRMTSEPDTT
jgi:hypothetical protein